MKPYSDFKEKEKHFLYSQTINTSGELAAALDEFEKMVGNKKLHTVFRGVNEAKYQLYNSFQRMWFEYGLNDSGKDPYQFVQNMINRCFNRKHVLFKYFKQLGVICNDWLILSFLQHYGGASPLLDFSKNYKVALYFLCKSMKPYYGKEEINHYASIYYYKYVEAGKKFISLYRYAHEIVKDKTLIHKDNIWKNELRFSSVMKNIPNSEPIIIPAHNNRTHIKTKENKIATYYTVSNINLTSQKGEFVCNMDVEQPLEDVFQKDGKKYLCCLNIHKDLQEHIIENYLKGSLEQNDSLYFPSEEQIAKDALERTLKDINLAKTK